MPIPVLVVGDAPNQRSGLARIAHDLTAGLWQTREALGIEVAQAGIRYDGSPWPWRVYPLHDEANWGASDFAQVWGWHTQGTQEPGVILSVWDPARCVPLVSWWEANGGNPPLWGYFAVDAEGRGGRFGGPAGEALKKYARVLGYTGWGSRVLAETLGKDRVEWLPHGISVRWQADAAAKVGLRAFPRIGCVATNQPRKDLAMFFEAAAMLRDSGPEWAELSLWLHTDVPVAAWSVPELAETWGWNNRKLEVTMDWDNLTDADLAARYNSCTVTFAPGLGEGFGYPIVESLACGVLVVGVDYAGGAELIPPMWRVAPYGWRWESSYCLRRPVWSAASVARTLKAAMEWKVRAPHECAAYCTGAVEHLRWPALQQYWLSWFRKGLAELRDREESDARG